VNISAIVITKNEEKNIKRCLESLKFANEIIIIDDFSSDNTRKIARSRGARVFKRHLNNDFASQRNFGLKKAKSQWVLFIDADEIVSSSLSKEIVRRVKENSFAGFFIPRKTLFFNKQLKLNDKPAWDWSLGPIKLIRLARKNSGQWKGKVHEIWEIKGEIGQLKSPILHQSYQNITQALKKINFYSSIKAQNDFKANKKTSLSEIIFFPIAKFFKNFIFQLGFLDGARGVIFCLLMSLHSFLVKAKLWQLKEDK